MKRLVVTSSLVIAILAVCQGAGAKKPKPGAIDSELAQAPALSDTWKNPYEGDADAREAGRKLFRRHCASCHGGDAHGRDKAPDLHSDSVQGASPGRLFWFLKNGNLKAGMPSWSAPPDQQKWQLVTFVKSLRQPATR